jgi:DHA1 family bicyclomycin/chloramphenicol resistance-like MFS transporter
MLALLIAIAAVGPMSLNIVMPALPGIATALGTDIETVQLTLSLYLVCMAVSQLTLGALSDRFGRRRVLLAGLVLAVATSFAAMIASSIASLIVARALQAFGASSGIVISRAIVRDLFDRDRAASMLGWVTMVIMVVPMIVPPLGGLLETTLGWQAIFACIGAFSVVVLAWVWRALPETAALSVGESRAHYVDELGALMQSRRFLGYVLCGGTNSALFYAFLGGAPHVVITLMGKSSFELGVWLASASLVYAVGNYCSARYSMRFGSDTMVAAGAIVGVFGGLSAVVLVVLFPQGGPIVVIIPQWITALANGFLMPNALAGAISVRPHAAGAASGIHGFMQMFIGAVCAQWVSHLLVGATTALPMAWVLFGASVACAASFFGLVWPRTVLRLQE